MNLLLPLAAAALPAISYANPGELQLLDTAFLTLPGPMARESMEKTMSDISGVMTLYHPKGAKISQLNVSSNGPYGVPRVSFVATFSMGFLSKSASIVGDLKSSKAACKSKPGSAGYLMEMDLRGSDPMISDTYQSFLLELCAIDIPGGSLAVTGTAYLKEGSKSGGMMAPVLRHILKQQAKPVTDALVERFTFNHAALSAAELSKAQQILQPCNACNLSTKK